MMKFKKFLAAAMTGAMMLGTVVSAMPAVSAYAAEDKSVYDIKINYTDFTATIFTKEEDQPSAYIILEVLKKETDSKASATYAYPVVEFEDNDNDYTFGVIVDLSFLKISKEAYLRVYGDNEDVTSAVKTVNPQLAKFTMKYTSGKSVDKFYEAFTINKAAATSVDALAPYVYRTLYGTEFQSLSKFQDVKEVTEIAGTTLVVRKKAVEEGESDNAGVISAEVKVKISAAPKAPKVTIDYLNNVVKFPKSVKYAVVGDEMELTDWVNGDTKAFSLSPADILENCSIVDDEDDTPATDMLAEGFSLVVYTPSSGKKADSVHAIVPIPGANTVTTDEESGKVSISDTVYATLKKTDTGYTLTATGGDFGYCLDDPTSASAKWTTVKAGATKAINMTKDTDGKLYVKGMGNKTSETLPTSNYEQFSWFKIQSIEVKVNSATITATANASVTVTATVTATAGATNDDKKVTFSVSGGLEADADGKIAIGADTAAGKYTVTATSTADSSVKGTVEFTVVAAE